MKKPSLNPVSRAALCFTLLMVASVFSMRAGVTYWDPQGTGGANPYVGDLSGTWENAKWSSASAGVASGAAFVEGDTPDFSVHTGVGTPAYTITMNANHTVQGLFCGFNASSSTNSIVGTGVLTIGTSAAEYGVYLTSGSFLTISNVMAGPGILTLQYTGQIFLNGANTFTGGVELGYSGNSFSGIVNFNNAASFGAGPIVVNNTGGNNVGLVAEGTNAITIPNSISWPTLGGGLNIVGNAAGVTFSGPITLASGVTNAMIGSGSTGNLVILSGQISGGSSSGKLNIFNPSTLQLAGSNTFAPQLTISNGVLQIANNFAIPSGSGGKNVVLESPGILDLNGFSPNINGLTETTTGGVVTNSTGTGTLTFGNNNATVTNNGTIVNTPGSTLNIAKVGTGTQTLSGVNTYNGSTTISAGTLKVGIANALPSTTVVTVASGATLNLNNLADTVKSVSSAGTLSLGSGTLTLSGTTGETISGAITGTGSVAVTGGTGITLSGANTYSGTLTITTGTVVANAANTLPSNSTVNMNGGTLDLEFASTVKTLKYAGTTKPPGTYGSPGSGATFTSSQFTGLSKLTVTSGSSTTTTVTSDHQSVSSGTQVTFTVTVTGASGDGSIPDGSVTLYDNGVSIGTATLTPSTGTTSTATFPPMTLSTGSHPITASWAGNSSYGASTSSIYNQTVVVTPVFTNPTSPVTTNADAGTTVNLTVTVGDGTSMSYQWQKGGVNLTAGSHANAATISGITSATVTLASVRLADASGSLYTCIASNAAGTATSTTFALTVNDPAIGVQPPNTNFECGTSPSLTVTAFGTTNSTGRLSYQWYKSTTLLSDATNSSLPFPNVHASSAGSYTVTVANAFGNTITSQVAVVSVADSTQPVLVGVPASTTISCSSAVPAAPSVTATDTCDAAPVVTLSAVTNAGSCPQNSSIVRTWTATDASNNSSSQSQTITIIDTNGPVITLTNGSPINAECHVTYVDPGYSASDACAGSVGVTVSGNVDTNTIGTYTLTYTAVDPCNNTNIATRVVHVVDTTGPVITILGNNPDTACYLGGAYVDPGATANDACSGPASVSTNGSVNTSVVGTYTITYSSLDPTFNLRTVTRVVQVITCGPTITHDLPANASVTLGGTITLSITAESLAPITYQWYKFGGSLSGQTNSSLLITNASGVNFGNYYCAVTAGSYTSNSTTCALTINNPGINSQPGDMIVVAGGTTNLTVDAGGTAPLTYHWFRNGIPLKNTTTFIGAFLPSLTLANVSQKSVGGDYTCWITNGNGASIVTSPARVTVYDPPIVKVTPTVSKPIEGTDVTLTAKLTKGGTNTATLQTQQVYFHWYFQTTNQPQVLLAETNNILVLHKVRSPEDSGIYTCVVTNYTADLTNGSSSCGMTVQLSKAPAGVIILKPTNPGTKPALTQGAVVTDALSATGGSGPNVAPAVDVSGMAHDNGLLVSVVLSNAPDTNVIPMSFVNKATLGQGSTPTLQDPIAKKPATFWVHTTLHDGTNAFTAYVTDATGNVSTNNKPTPMYYMAYPSMLTIQTNGSGKTGKISALITTTTAKDTKIWGVPANGATLEMGHSYVLQASGAPNTNFLVQWDMSDANGPLPSVPGNNTSTATLNFIMSSNLTISARYQNGH